MGLNKVMLIGNVGQDPSLSFNNGNQLERANFSLATTERYKLRTGEKGQTTEWHRIVVTGPLTNIIESYVKKGTKIYVEGKLTTRTYDKDGQKHFITEVIASAIELLNNLDSSN